jgi:hypothetical protein
MDAAVFPDSFRDIHSPTSGRFFPLATCVRDNISSDIDRHLNTSFHKIRQCFEQFCSESDLPDSWPGKKIFKCGTGSKNNLRPVRTPVLYSE